MEHAKREISREQHDGFVLVKLLIDGGPYYCADFEAVIAETPTGDYIGDEERARYLVGNRGIAPAKIKPEHGICSIGFCAREQRWYGWSHRAICGFGIGSEVRRGDIAYVPTGWDDFKRDCLRFWSEKDHTNVTAVEGEENGIKGVWVRWQIADSAPNVAARGEVCGSFMVPPGQWGRGEWIAKTLDDAKQMAIDYAEDVS